MGISGHDDDIDGAVLARYLESPSPADEAQVARWLAQDPAHAAELVRVQEMWAQTRKSPAADSAGAWQAVMGRMGASRTALAQRTPRITALAGRPYRFAMSFTAAAMLLVAIGAGVIWKTNRLANGMRSYRTAPGQRETVTLADGTQFTLAPSSVLRVPADYAMGNRMVSLDGEAMFAVVHDRVHPFAVRVRNAVATDIGTRFDIRAYAGDAITQIAVTEGIVSFVGAGRRSARASAATLYANDIAIISDTNATVAHNASVFTITSWTTGTLVFNNVPLRKVLDDLSRWYGLSLQATGAALRDTPVTLTVRDGPPDQAIDGLALLLHARVVRRGPAVMFAANPNDR